MVSTVLVAIPRRTQSFPSKVASIIDTIIDRRYVFKKGNSLVPSWTAFSVSKLLEMHFPNLVDCRPIYVKGALEAAGYKLKKQQVETMWVPVEIVLGVK